MPHMIGCSKIEGALRPANGPFAMIENPGRRVKDRPPPMTQRSVGCKLPFEQSALFGYFALHVLAEQPHALGAP
jgi:hypothetical protein